MNNIDALKNINILVSEHSIIFNGVTIVSAEDLVSLHHPTFPPNRDTVIINIDSKSKFIRIMDLLLTVYPAEHEIYVFDGAKSDNPHLAVNLADLADKTDQFDLISFIVPSLGDRSSFEEFQELIALLRSPEGCPWDREQTHESLRENLLEEAYEVLAAIDSGDFDAIQEELGDLLLQIVLQTQIATEASEFRMTDVIKGIFDKLVNRHPHVFGTEKILDAVSVKQNWERIKIEERKEKGESEKGLLDGVPINLPALSQADVYQKRAARIGFDWPNIENVLEKINEEVGEIIQADSIEDEFEEIGDLLFTLVNFARWRNVDPESALRKANAKFKTRFSYIENQAKQDGNTISNMSLEEMEKIWLDSKN